MNLKAILPNPAGRGERAFTMVEIAISIAIVAFALIAIIGVLPTGLNVQRDNREDTIISQDAAFLMECIRSGPVGLEILTNYLDAVQVTTDSYDPNTGALTGTSVVIYSNSPPASVITASRAISFLTQPTKYPPRFADNNVYTVKLRFRAFSGNVGEQGTTRGARDFAFSYFVTPEIRPFGGSSKYPSDEVSFPFNSPSNTAAATPVPLTPLEKQRSNYWAHARAREENLYEVKLNFEWPVRSVPGNSGNPASYMGVAGSGRHSFRTMVSGTIETNAAGTYIHFAPGRMINTVPINYP